MEALRLTHIVHLTSYWYLRINNMPLLLHNYIPLCNCVSQNLNQLVKLQNSKTSHKKNLSFADNLEFTFSRLAVCRQTNDLNSSSQRILPKITEAVKPIVV